MSYVQILGKNASICPPFVTLTGTLPQAHMLTGGIYKTVLQ